MITLFLSWEGFFFLANIDSDNIKPGDIFYNIAHIDMLIGQLSSRPKEHSKDYMKARELFFRDR